MTTSQGWALLVISGLVDVAWAYATKRSEGFTHVGWGIASLLLLALFITLLSKALEVLPLGTAYAVWTGIGAVGAFAVGILFLEESLAAARIIFASLTIIGVVGLKVSA